MHDLDEALPNGKSVLFPSPIPNFMLSFTPRELEEVKGLFQETLLVLEVDKIFADNKWTVIQLFTYVAEVLL